MSKRKNKKRHVWQTQPQVTQPSGKQIVGIHQSQTLAYSGPIPMASELGKYEQISTGSADRLIAMAEKQEAHRHGLETTVVGSNVKNERLGMHYTFTLTGVLMLFGAAMIFTDKEAGGYFALFGPVVFQGGNYIYHKKRERKVSHPPKDEISK